LETGRSEAFDRIDSIAGERTRPRVQWLAPRQPFLSRAGHRLVIALRPPPTGEAPVGTREGACAPQIQLH
jgi:hypothetical protein